MSVVQCVGCRAQCVYLTENVYKNVLQKSIPVQKKQVAQEAQLEPARMDKQIQNVQSALSWAIGDGASQVDTPCPFAS